MKACKSSICCIVVSLFAFGILTSAAQAERHEPKRVMVIDRGVTERIIGPGAPAHVIGLWGRYHEMDIDTGRVLYGLRYGAAVDEKLGGEAQPGEGYIGMVRPTNANWYHGGFFDLIINGRSIGTSIPEPLYGLGGPERGHVDFVFDTPQAVVRVRFVGRRDDNLLLCQVKLEPKEEITQMRLALRNYPSAFSSSADRRIETALEEIPQGENRDIDPAAQWWALYYDTILDLGGTDGVRTGMGPCAALWVPGQTASGRLNAGGYSCDTNFELKPGLTDYRFIFFDFRGIANADAQAEIHERAETLLQELVSYDFTNRDVVQWPLEQRWNTVTKLCDGLEDGEEMRAKFEDWYNYLEPLLRTMQAGESGAIISEAAVSRIIHEWESSEPELKLKALFEEI